jgi:anti-anti-sigma regulatory factor
MATKTRFSCGETLDIVNANTLLIRLAKALEKSSTIEISADKVVKCDTAGLQIFVALHKETTETGGCITWKKPSNVLVNNAKRLGLTHALGLSD